MATPRKWQPSPTPLAQVPLMPVIDLNGATSSLRVLTKCTRRVSPITLITSGRLPHGTPTCVPITALANANTPGDASSVREVTPRTILPGGTPRMRTVVATIGRHTLIPWRSVPTAHTTECRSRRKCQKVAHMVPLRKRR